MSKNIKGITISLDGDASGLTQALKKVDSETKSVQNELKQVEKLLKLDPSNVELLAQKQKLLQQSVEGTTKRLDALKQAQAQVEQQFQSGEIGEEAYRKFQREIIATEGKLKAFQKQADNVKVKIDAQADTTGIDKMKSALKELGPAAKQAASEIGSGLKTGATVTTAAVGALVVGSNELSNDLAKLRTNAEMAGHDLGLVEGAFKQIAVVSGETDSAVETVSNLLASGFKDNQLEQVIEGINGAAIKFSDTLKTEGIADGLQETFASGEAIGQFGELLERSGVDLESFNKKLAIAKQNGTETDFVMQTMADLGLTKVSEKYRESNEELVKNAEATLKMQMAMADLAIVLTPLVTMVTDFVSGIVEWASENEGLAKTVAVVAGVITALSGVITVLSPIITTIISNWKYLKLAISAISGPIGIAIAAITAITVAGIALYKNWDSVSAWLSKTWSTIKSNAVSAFSQTKASIVKTWSETKNFLVNLWSSLKNLATSIFSGLKNTVVNLLKNIGSTFTNIWSSAKNSTLSTFNNIRSIITTVISTVKGVITAGLQLITGNWKGAFNTLKTTASNMVTSITGIFKGTNLFTVGKQIISGLIRGISNMKDAALNAIAGVANGVINKAKSLLRIFSPSREFHEIGEYIGQGWANGIKASQKVVEKSVSNVAKVIKNAASKNAAAITAIEKAAEKERNAVRKEYAEKRKSIKKGDSKALAKLEKQLQAELKKINDKAAKDILAKEKQLNKEKLAAVESYIKKKKDANELSLFQEAQYYRAASQQLKKGSAEQISAQTSYKNLVNTINNEIVSINNDYLKRTQDINNNLIKGEEELNKKYEDAYKARYQTILGYYGLFDEVKEREAVSGSEIIGNLQDQITELNLWRNQLGRLEAKGLSETMLEDLRGMGPSILSQLEALNKMTDEELSKYQRLYEEKMTFASVTATKELAPDKKKLEQDITDLRATANSELDALNTEWQKAIYKVVQGTDETFSTLQQVGKNAAQNLIDGLSGMENSLLNKAREIATNVSNAINSALNISGNANLGASITASLNTASSSLASSAAKTQSTSTQSTSNKISGLNPLVAAIVKLANRPVETSVNLDGKTVASAVSGHQYNNTTISALMKGVPLK